MPKMAKNTSFFISLLLLIALKERTTWISPHSCSSTLPRMRLDELPRT
ncbi:unnamed protein product [Penicillium camemberti]|uniref:Str. FM013 n=1 Tax=Penicillium camemberti (strain FM 013) TaxID=1429867 RepID=A0A0G4PUX9_PENC3|nr:unnamed protein product [Penicillium camemberti]